MEFKREIERKFIVKGTTYEEARKFLGTLAIPDLHAISYDLYWEAPNVDFVRLRDNSQELTVKVTDKGTVVDRIEENVLVSDESMATAGRLLTLLFGPPKMKLTKKFSVYRMYEPAAKHLMTYKYNEVVVCLYQVKEDPTKRLFLEVEANSLDVVDEFLREIHAKLTMTAENRSLYQIFSEEGVKDAKVG